MPSVDQGQVGECSSCSVSFCIVDHESYLHLYWVYFVLAICLALCCYIPFFLFERSLLHKPHVENLYFAFPMLLIWAAVFLADYRPSMRTPDLPTSVLARIWLQNMGRDLIFMYVVATRSKMAVFKPFTEPSLRQEFAAAESRKMIMHHIPADRLIEARVRVKVATDAAEQQSMAGNENLAKQLRRMAGKTGRVYRDVPPSSYTVNFGGKSMDIPKSCLQVTDIPSLLPAKDLDMQADRYLYRRRATILANLYMWLEDDSSHHHLRTTKGMGILAYTYIAIYMLELLGMAFPKTWGVFLVWSARIMYCLLWASFLGYVLARLWNFHRRQIAIYKTLSRDLLLDKFGREHVNRNWSPVEQKYRTNHSVRSQLFRQVLSKLNMGRLLMYCPRAVQLLTNEKYVGDMSKPNSYHNTYTKAILIDAIMQQGAGAQRDYQDILVKLILSCDGIEATKLKVLIDGGCNIHTFYKLVCEDIRSVDKRVSILAHLRKQSWKVRAENKGSVGIKVLSDIDDTLYSSGGHFPAGCDKRFGKHVFYPGVLELYESIDKGDTCFADPLIARSKNTSSNKVFVSARPHVYKDALEAGFLRTASALFDDGKLESHPTMIPGGALQSGRGAALQKCKGPRAWRHAGQMKFQSFVMMTDMYNEYDFVFFGDDGQGDLYAGQKMIDFMYRDRTQALEDAKVRRLSRYASRVKEQTLGASATAIHDKVRYELGEDYPQLSRMLCVLIHNVYPENEKLMCCKKGEVLSKWDVQEEEEDDFDDDDLENTESPEDKCKLKRYSTYIGAAGELFMMGVISRQSLEKVALKAMEDLRAVRQDLNKVEKPSKRKKGLDNFRNVEKLYQADLEKLRLIQLWYTYEQRKAVDDQRRGLALEDSEEDDSDDSESTTLIHNLSKLSSVDS